MLQTWQLRSPIRGEYLPVCGLKTPPASRELRSLFVHPHLGTRRGQRPGDAQGQDAADLCDLARRAEHTAPANDGKHQSGINVGLDRRGRER